MRTARPILPWIVWGVAIIGYVMSITNRSSLAALGPAAQRHFEIDATTLAMFAVIQLIVYAGLQVPVGILLDRFGSSVLIVAGGILMVIGQLVMATVLDVPLAILARVLLGAGDACTFISVIRLLPEWFALRQLPTVSQLTAQLGALGQLISVTPLALFVHEVGWMNGFLALAGTGLVIAVLCGLILRDHPGRGTVFERATGRLGSISRHARSFAGNESTAELSAVAPPATSMILIESGAAGGSMGIWRKFGLLLRIPGVRLAFWVHFTPPFANTVLLLLWGTPFLTGGVGLSAAASASLLSLAIISSVFAGVLLGPLTSRFVERRVTFVIATLCLIMLIWSLVMLWPGTPPYWLLLVLVLAVPIGGPASMVSFEVLRSHAPRSYLGIATGIVNMGGFIAALLVILFIGLALDVQGAGEPADYSLTAFRWAFATQIPVWVLGLVMIVIETRRTRLWMLHHGRTLR